MASGSGWNLCVWLVGVVVRRYIYFNFPHTTYPYSSSICSFLQQHPYFLFILKMFFILVIIMPGWNAHGLQSKLLITPFSE